jgi:hypothetical protein
VLIKVAVSYDMWNTDRKVSKNLLPSISGHLNRTDEETSSSKSLDIHGHDLKHKENGLAVEGSLCNIRSGLRDECKCLGTLSSNGFVCLFVSMGFRGKPRMYCSLAGFLYRPL